MFNFFYRYDTFESTKVRRSRKAKFYFLYIMLFSVLFLTAIFIAIVLTLDKGNFFPTGLFPQIGIAVAFGIGYFASFGAIFGCGVLVLKYLEDKH